MVCLIWWCDIRNTQLTRMIDAHVSKCFSFSAFAMRAVDNTIENEAQSVF